MAGSLTFTPFMLSLLSLAVFRIPLTHFFRSLFSALITLVLVGTAVLHTVIVSWCEIQRRQFSTGAGSKPACLRRLEETLEWRHMAPTAPETLGCYPFVTEDPFIVEVCVFTLLSVSLSSCSIFCH